MAAMLSQAGEFGSWHIRGHRATVSPRNAFKNQVDPARSCGTRQRSRDRRLDDQTIT